MAHVVASAGVKVKACLPQENIQPAVNLLPRHILNCRISVNLIRVFYPLSVSLCAFIIITISPLTL